MNESVRLPATPEDAEREALQAQHDAYIQYRKATRKFRRTFRGIITRRECERFVIARLNRQARVLQEQEGQGV